MAAAANRVTLNVPTVFNSSVNLKLLISIGVLSRDNVRPPVPPPATLTTTPSGARSVAASMAAATSASLLTSPPTAAPRPRDAIRASPASSARSNTTTGIPRPCSRRTVAAPRPPAPPVTIADRSLQFNVPPFEVPPLRLVTLTTSAKAEQGRWGSSAGRPGPFPHSSTRRARRTDVPAPVPGGTRLAQDAALMAASAAPSAHW